MITTSALFIILLLCVCIKLCTEATVRSFHVQSPYLLQADALFFILAWVLYLPVVFSYKTNTLHQVLFPKVLNNEGGSHLFKILIIYWIGFPEIILNTKGTFSHIKIDIFLVWKMNWMSASCFPFLGHRLFQ